MQKEALSNETEHNQTITICRGVLKCARGTASKSRIEQIVNGSNAYFFSSFQERIHLGGKKVPKKVTKRKKHALEFIRFLYHANASLSSFQSRFHFSVVRSEKYSFVRLTDRIEFERKLSKKN